jgi:hypothetical protein
MISSFHKKDLVRVDKFDTLLLPDVCKYKSEEMGLKSWDKEDKVKAIRAVRNKEMRYFHLPKNVVFPVLYCAIMYTEIRTLLKPCSQNWGVGQLFLQLLKRNFLCVSYYLSVNISDALGTMLED